jgi:hypothetical protein
MLIFKATIKQQNVIRKLIEKISAFDPPPNNVHFPDTVDHGIFDLTLGILAHLLPNHVMLSQYIDALPVSSPVAKFVNLMHQFSTFNGALAIALLPYFNATNNQLKQAQIRSPFSTEPARQPSPIKPQEDQNIRQVDKPVDGPKVRSPFSTGPAEPTKPSDGSKHDGSKPPILVGGTDPQHTGTGGGVGGEGGPNQPDVPLWDRFLSAGEQLKRFFFTALPNKLRSSMISAFSNFMSEDTAKVVTDTIISSIYTPTVYATYGLIAALPALAIYHRFNLPRIVLSPFAALGTYLRAGIEIGTRYLFGERGTGELRFAFIRHLFDPKNSELSEKFNEALGKVRANINDVLAGLITSAENPVIARVVQVFSPQTLGELLKSIQASYDKLSTDLALNVQIEDTNKPQWKREIEKERSENQRDLDSKIREKEHILNQIKRKLQNYLDYRGRPFKINASPANKPEIVELIRSKLGINITYPLTNETIQQLIDAVEQLKDEAVLIDIARDYQQLLDAAKSNTQRVNIKDILKEVGILTGLLRNYDSVQSDIQNLLAAKDQLENNPLQKLNINLSIKISIPVEPGQIFTSDISDIVRNANSAEEIVNGVLTKLANENAQFRNMLRAQGEDGILFGRSIRSLIAISLYRALEDVASLDPSLAARRNDLIKYVFESNDSFFKKGNLNQLPTGQFTHGQFLHESLVQDKTLLKHINEYNNDPQQAVHIGREVLQRLHMMAILAAMSSNELYHQGVSRSLATAYENMTFIRHLGSLVLRTDAQLYSDFLKSLVESNIPLTDTVRILETAKTVFEGSGRYPGVFPTDVAANPDMAKELIINKLAQMARDPQALQNYKNAIKNVQLTFSTKMPSYLGVTIEEATPGQSVRLLREAAIKFAYFSGIGLILDPTIRGLLSLADIIMPPEPGELPISKNPFAPLVAGPIGGWIWYSIIYPFAQRLFGYPPEPKRLVFSGSISLPQYHQNHVDPFYRNLADRYDHFLTEMSNYGVRLGSLQPQHFNLANLFKDNIELSPEDFKRIRKILSNIETRGIETGVHPTNGLVMDHLFSPAFDAKKYIFQLIHILAEVGGLDLTNGNDLKLIKPLIGIVTLRGLWAIASPEGIEQRAAAIARKLATQQTQPHILLRDNIRKLNNEILLTPEKWDVFIGQAKAWHRAYSTGPSVIQTLPQAQKYTLTPDHINILAEQYRQDLLRELREKLEDPKYALLFEERGGLISTYAKEMAEAYKLLLQFGNLNVLKEGNLTLQDLQRLSMGLYKMNKALRDLAFGLSNSSVQEYRDNFDLIMRDVLEVQRNRMTRSVDHKTLNQYLRSQNIARLSPEDLNMMVQASETTSEMIKHLQKIKDNYPDTSSVRYQLEVLSLGPGDVNKILPRPGESRGLMQTPAHHHSLTPLIPELHTWREIRRTITPKAK